MNILLTVLSKKGTILNTLTALVLFTALMGNPFVQFLHSFEDHGHPPCTEKSTHFHEGNNHCYVCDFQISSFDYNVYNQSFLGNSLPRTAMAIHTSSFVPSECPINHHLRGPPYILS
ncbi:MAG: hypothetical protein QGH06_08835 [Lutibacter sp.]|nr:hypothetical protein [Lutibacter sp.]